jgi:protoporphyrinogen oxidase
MDHAHVKTAILGGGPAGLAAAYELAKNGQQCLLLEKSNTLGGIAKTVKHDDYYFDLGGHRFFTNSDTIHSIWHEILTPTEFLTRPRLSRIYYKQKFFNYPLKPQNAILGLGIYESIKILLSYCKAKLFPQASENNFADWVSNRFGHRLYELFFKTYTEKVWGCPCTTISAEWAAQRIKNLTLFSAIKNALFPQQKKHITTLIDEFEYPQYGPSMMWEKMAQKIQTMGGQILTNANVTKIIFNNNKATHIEINNKQQITIDHIISSLPLQELIPNISPTPENKVVNAAKFLPYRDFITVVLLIDEKEIFADNWIYIHSPDVLLGRVQNFKNWSPFMVADQSKTCLGLEYFCFAGDQLWNMQDQDLINFAIDELTKIALLKDKTKVLSGTVVRVPKAYPAYTGDYKNHLNIIHDYLNCLNNLQTIGRNGLHRYNNMDHSMLTGIYAAQNILGSNHNIWQINTDNYYHEEK